VRDELGTDILKAVSRSFYLTLRLLPVEMREAASLGYLLARASDTIADTEGVSVDRRVSLLTDYADSVAHGDPPPAWPEEMVTHATEGEARLLYRVPQILDWLSGIDARQAELIREVVATIIGGQLGDLKWFARASGDSPVPLPDPQALDDYTWSVAGCVGAFWTKLGFLTLGERFSTADQEELLRKGINYGKGLQLVNILRDLPRDLAAGRCYLPVSDPEDRQVLMESFRHWRNRASHFVAEGLEYADALDSRRLRAASVLPALLAEETLARLAEAKWEDLQARIKVPRSRVYALMLRALIW